MTSSIPEFMANTARINGHFAVLPNGIVVAPQNAVVQDSPTPASARLLAGMRNIASTHSAGESRPELASALFNALAISLFVVTMLLAVTITGCGESQQPPVAPVTNVAPPPPPQIQPTPKPVEKTVKASYYGPGFSGQKTASGEPFNPDAMTAASKTLPIGSVVRVTNPKTGRSVNVRINDRGPNVKGRSLDLSKGAARKIGLTGVERVKIRKIKTHSETEIVETSIEKPHDDAVTSTAATAVPSTANATAASSGAPVAAATEASNAAIPVAPTAHAASDSHH